MRDEHVIAILERGPFGKLSESELAEVRAHAARCDDCRRAYEATQISSAMLRERAAAEVFEPSPFFQTRVLSALRERRAAEQASWALPRLWKTAGALFASMVATVAALGALTFLAPDAPQAESAGDAAAAEGVYIEDESILALGEAAGGGEMTYEQVLTALYEAEDGGQAR